MWRCAIRPPLPYAIRCRVELARVRAPALVVARVTGDIVGDARLELTEIATTEVDRRSGGDGSDDDGPATDDDDGSDDGGSDDDGPATDDDGASGGDGPATEARITSRLEARRLPARVLSRVAPGAARWGHDWVFDTAARQFGVAGLGAVPPTRTTP